MCEQSTQGETQETDETLLKCERCGEVTTEEDMEMGGCDSFSGIHVWWNKKKFERFFS